MTESDEAALRAELAQSRANAEVLAGRIDHLQKAVQSNRRIGMALGILMTHHQLTEAEAFNRLVQSSQQQNRKLAAIAEEVIYTGHL
ncbi:ANTAR domain-containing protein [uncultured Modestobacter sp.]|uniref:ANTAR domain-containing protein n=1 Tax=uncultured Modestobacter sp. TaxID=380048 RepID=UPI00260904F2|nr:ANTAR domain-containing protein [uncultured Modestobacter sp.]